jgi:hypothetical protein
MKNNFNKLSKMILAVGSIVILFGCTKTFLDQKSYTSTVLSDAIKNEDDLNTAINGLYSSLRATDLYGRSLAVKGDLMADHCFLSAANSGRYLSFNNYNIAKNDGYASALWANAYASIKNANLVINSGLDVSKPNVSQLVAEAYAIRGMIYFDLVRNFGTPYTIGDPNTNLGVPIVTGFDINGNPAPFDLNAKPARATVAAVYTQVLADLNKAFSLAKFNQGDQMNFLTNSGAVSGKSRVVNSSFMSKYAIEVLLARVYQNKGDWTNAKNAANDVIVNSGFSLIPASGLIAYWKGATPLTSKTETMFEVTSDANNSVSDGTLANLYVPKPVGSYGDILALKSFYDSYTSTDVRKGLYNPTSRSGQLGTAYYITKYPIDPSNYDDVKMVRFSEAYLILAEAKYNLGDIAGANTTLNTFAVTRDPNKVYASTGTQVLEDILNERLKEFSFEGYRFWDLTRLGRTFTKAKAIDASNLISSSTLVLPSNTNLIFPIPNDEILVNPNMVQNPGY